MRKFFGWFSLAALAATIVFHFVFPHAAMAWTWYDYVGNFLIGIWEVSSVLAFIGMIKDDGSWLSTNTNTNWISLGSWILVILVAVLAIHLGVPASGIVYPWFVDATYFYIILGWPFLMMYDIVYKCTKIGDEEFESENLD